MAFDDMFSLVGHTPHLRVRTEELPEVRIYAKLEGYNPTGSIKDRACVFLMRDMLANGEMQPGKVLLDASSGNMACAIAFFGKIAGYPTRVFSNSKLTDDKRQFIEYFGAKLDVVGDFTIEGNRACRKIAAQEPERYCFLDQLHNPANPQAHYETTGPEILAEHPQLAMLVGSLGSGGSLNGAARFLKQKLPELKVWAVEAESGTRLPGTGAFVDGDYVTPFIQQGYEDKIFDRRIRVSYANAAAATLRLREQGIFTGIQTGGVYHASLVAAREEFVAGDVVFLSGDSGWKNMDKLRALE